MERKHGSQDPSTSGKPQERSFIFPNSTFFYYKSTVNLLKKIWKTQKIQKLKKKSPLVLRDNR